VPTRSLAISRNIANDRMSHVEAPSRCPPGFWLDNVTGLPRPETAEDTAAPLRLYDSDAFLRHAELLEDIKPAPHCIEDWLALFPDNFQKLLQGTRYHPRNLIIEPEGSKTHLHFDFLHSCGSSCGAGRRGNGISIQHIPLPNEK
jgi:hypothetical protein